MCLFWFVYTTYKLEHRIDKTSWVYLGRVTLPTQMESNGTCFTSVYNTSLSNYNTNNTDWENIFIHNSWVLLLYYTFVKTYKKAALCIEMCCFNILTEKQQTPLRLSLLIPPSLINPSTTPYYITHIHTVSLCLLGPDKHDGVNNLLKKLIQWNVSFSQ